MERSIAIKSEGENKRRNVPKSLKAISKELSSITNESESDCESKIIEILIWAEELNIKSANEKKKDTILPFKLHQFISQTGYVYLTLENASNRYVTLDPNPFVKLSDESEEIPVYQTVFSRISGEEFICVRKEIDESNGAKFVFRDFNENLNPKNDDDLKVNNKKVKQRSDDEYKDGYVIFDKDFLLDIKEYIDLLPSSWLTKTGEIEPIKKMRLPSAVYVNRNGSFSYSPNGGEKAWFIPAPLIYDPTCGVIYLETKSSEKTKLISLGNEGRSTSTTLLTFQTLLALYKNGKPKKEQKLMSFTDNRQDASLQAGHFNDFIQVVHLRSAIEKVLRSSSEPLKISDLIFKVQDALQLPEFEYAINPAPNPSRPNDDNLEALRNYITYRIIQDLKRAWRFVLPNLEQTALLDITYKNLDATVVDATLWNEIDLVKEMSTEKRKDFILQILNYFRNMYAVDFEMLRHENRLKIESELNQLLNKEKLWSLDRGEKIEAPNFLSLQGADKLNRDIFIQSIGPSSRLARYIKHEFRNAGKLQPSTEEYNAFMTKVLDALADVHYLKKASIKAEKGDKDAYQLILTSVLWQKGDKITVTTDKTSYISLHNTIKIKPHKYFQDLYQEDFAKLPKS